MATRTLGQKPVIKEATKELTKSDRCDADCPAQAYVLVVGLEGELMFCAHHYNKIMSNEKGKAAMESFAIETIKQEEAS